jgi:circadian clock protein KaiC
MVDTWLLLRDLESNGERNKVLYVLKSRGMNHSNQVREFHITSKGVKLVEAYLGPAGVLTGSARLAQEALSRKGLEQKELALTHRRKAMEAQIESLQAAFHAEEEEFRRSVATEKNRLGQVEIDREAMARSRRATARRARNNHR